MAFPTDARLYHKTRRALVRVAEERSIDLRQNCERLRQRGLHQTGPIHPCPPAQEGTEANPQTANFLGRVIRDIRRKCQAPDESHAKLLALEERIFSQTRNDTNKVYSVHAPVVECIAKGKAHKRYEFGRKVAILHQELDFGHRCAHDNPFDGHTLKQVKRTTGWQPLHGYCDRGDRGAGKEITDTTVHLAGPRKKNMKPGIWRWYARRAAIEPIFGHLKSDNRLELKGKDGDRMNAIPAGCGFDMRKFTRSFLLAYFPPLHFWPEGRPALSKSNGLQPCLCKLRTFSGTTK